MQYYTILDLVRHGPKDNLVSHGTGVEAGLDTSKAGEIIAYARKIPASTNEGINRIALVTSPLQRSIDTAAIVYDTLVGMGAGQDYEISAPVVMDAINSSFRGPNGKPVNLSPQEMSRLWGEGKKMDSYGASQGEHVPLSLWMHQGLDNEQAQNQENPGISLREIARIVNSGVYDILTNPENSRTRVLAYGHSGDLEPAAALALFMYQGKDDGLQGSSKEDLAEFFNEQLHGKGLEPLTGARFGYDANKGLYVSGPAFGFEEPTAISLDVFRRQKTIQEEHGAAAEVLEAKLNLMKQDSA